MNNKNILITKEIPKCRSSHPGTGYKDQTIVYYKTDFIIFVFLNMTQHSIVMENCT